MKIILAGSTGFIGREVLEQCLQTSSITAIIALSRRDLPLSASNNSKLKVVIMDDFLCYPESVLIEIKGAEACIWCLGKAWMPDNDSARKVCIDYTIAAAKAFTPSSPSDDGNCKKFRFIYLSGGAAERDQTRSLLFKQDYRRIRGQVENELLAHTKKHQESFETYIMRPGLVLAKETSLRDLIRSLGPSIRVDKLASVMVRAALSGSKSQIYENAAINE
ncbi:MAG: hypothetical protein Q9164_002408 [Protoblastenia rupestris]